MNFLTFCEHNRFVPIGTYFFHKKSNEIYRLSRTGRYWCALTIVYSKNPRSVASAEQISIDSGRDGINKNNFQKLWPQDLWEDLEIIDEDKLVNLLKKLINARQLVG